VPDTTASTSGGPWPINRPNASAAEKPKTRSAPGFQSWITACESAAMIALPLLPNKAALRSSERLINPP
jgi:hypothetical protein